MNTLIQQIMDETRTLPQNTLTEILDFIQFLRQKDQTKVKRNSVICDIDAELRQMNNHELRHLEEEFESYKERYPQE